MIRWTEAGLEYEADPRPAERFVSNNGLDGSTNGVATPCLKPLAPQMDAENPLPEHQHTWLRGQAARGNDLWPDRPDVMYSGKEICRWMSAPVGLALSALKTLARYLAERPRLVIRYDYQTAGQLDVYTDTDWAGCPRTRKSTSGGCLMLGEHMLKCWSATQASVVLSAGEAKLYGVVRGAGVNLRVRALYTDLGLALPLGVCGPTAAPPSA